MSLLKHLHLYLFILLPFFTSAILADNKLQKVAGAGPSTFLVTEFFSLFEQTSAAQGYSFNVPPRSVKHAGGIKASSHYLFGRTGRPLKQKEKNKQKFEILLAKIPLAFVTGKQVGAQHLSINELKDIYNRKTEHWGHISPNKKIVLAGREPTEAALNELIKTFPFLQNIKFDIIFKKDHQLVNYLNTKAGNYALGFGAKSNLEKFNQVIIKGIDVGVPVGLVVDESNRNHAIVQAVINFVKSNQWKKTVSNLGYVPL